MNPKITLYGYGYVGKAVYNFLKDHYGVQIIDPGYPEYQAGRPDLVKTSLAIVCVPTPMREDGSCDTSIVFSAISGTDHSHYLIKSTVPPGTVDRLCEDTGKAVVFSPEFIGEGKYEIPFWLDYPHPTNMKLHSFHIFGGKRRSTRVWVEIWQKIAGWNARYIQTNAKTAELVKYGENSFLATKKVFFDEMYEICQVLGIDYNEFKELMLLDGRVGRPMTLIFPDNRGFSGKCLPKDVNALIKFAGSAGHDASLLKAVLAANKKFRKE